jgi:hypothetical protein
VINAKGGESIKPKAKGPHHHFKKNSVYFKLVSRFFKKKEIISIDIWVNLKNYQLVSHLVPQDFSVGILFDFKTSISMKIFN